MSVESEDSFPLLQRSEDYPRWAQYAKSELQCNCCYDGIFPIKQFTKADAITSLKTYGFTDEEITEMATEVIEMVGDKIMLQYECRDKATEILRKLAGLQNQRLITDQTAEQIWKTLKERFQDVSPMSQLSVILKAGSTRMSDFTDVGEYCNTYQEALGQVCGMLEPDSVIDQKAAEAMLLACMLSNVSESYRPLVAQIRENWTSTNTDLFQACLSITRYHGVDSTTTALHVARKNPNRARKGTCDFEECVRAGLTTHRKEKCWRKHPNLRPKFALGKMKSRNSKTR